jgi:hypothetical protein
MDKEQYYKYMFLSAFIYNIIAGLLFGILPIFTDSFLPFFGIENPPSLIFVHLVVLCVCTFAVLYYQAARNLSKSRNIARVAGVAKILFFLIIFIYFLLDRFTSVSGCNWIAVLLLSVDGIQGLMFLEFYYRYDKFEQE